MARTFRYSRPRSEAEQSLIDYFGAKFPYLTREQWAQHIEAGHVTVRNFVKNTRKGGREKNQDTFGPPVDHLSGGYVLKQGDLITFSPPAELEPPVDASHIQILYEDQFIVVVAKNGCLPVSEGGRYCLNTLVAILEREGTQVFYGDETQTTECPPDEKRIKLECPSRPSTKIYSVHRLDKETSGVLVLAKTHPSSVTLSRYFMEKSKAIEQLFLAASGSADIISKLDPSLVKSKCGLEKTYVAVLVGCPDEGQVLINTGRIGLLSENEVHHTPDHQKLKKLKMFCYSGSDDKYGKPACTHVRIVASNPLLGLSVASITLFTGRSHQIRVHCADLGFPVLGDKLYSTTNPGARGFMHVASDDIYIERSKKDIGFFHPFQVPCRSQELNSTSTKCWLCQRHLLHSSTLAFDHPHSGERMTFSATPIKWFTRDVKSESPSDDAALRAMIKNACQPTA